MADFKTAVRLPRRMDIPDEVVAGVVAGAAILLLGLLAWIRRLRRRVKEVDSLKRSQSTRYGQTLEQFAPFLESWPWDPKRFRFIGSPIDGIQVTDDQLLIVEIKSANSRLSPDQQAIKALVQSGRVRWEEVRIR
ncbi:MAG: Holliday junction resolvase-like protein [Candidatus Thermoplasmatota archaeon]